MEQFLEQAKPLVAYVSLFIPLFFTLLWWTLYRENFPFASLNALIASSIAFVAVIVGFQHQDLDYWLSAALVLITLAVAVSIVVKSRNVRNRKVWLITALFVLINIGLFWGYSQQDIRGVTIKAMLLTEEKLPDGPSIDLNLTSIWEEEATKTFQSRTGAHVVIIPAPTDSTERLEKYLTQLQPNPGYSWMRDPSNDVDVFAIDVNWPSIMEQYAEDLMPFFEKTQTEFFADLFENNLVEYSSGHKKLVAVPWFVDMGLLYYRTDLLREHYGTAAPPTTWKQLEEMARTIQKDERNKRGELDDSTPGFWGFIWQGKAYEGLLCNALEWQVSQVGGSIINQSKEVTIVNPQVIKALETARSWINTISPSSVLQFDETLTFEQWKEGNAVFMRHWPYVYNASQSKDSAVQGKVGVALLPKGDSNDADHAATLGGWQLMVSNNSASKEKKAAVRFVQFLTDKDIQASLAKKTGKPPTRKALYQENSLQRELPYLEDMNEALTKRHVVQRPAKTLSTEYKNFSEAYFTAIHEILKGEDALRRLERLKIKIEELLNTAKYPNSQ